jgi:CheY-like chemotaxis protein
VEKSSVAALSPTDERSIRTGVLSVRCSQTGVSRKTVARQADGSVTHAAEIGMEESLVGFLSVPAERILVVEDNDDLRELYKIALRTAGFQVTQASDGLTALRAVEADRPDLIVLDLRLPLISGFEVQHQLSQLKAAHIPVVVVTALPRERTRGLNVAWVLSKPVMPEALVRTVVDCLAGRRMVQ